MKHEMNRPKALSASSLIGDGVVNAMGEDLGKVDEIMLDISTGRVVYAVLSFGGILGMGNKLFAIPWEAMTLDTDRKVFILNVDKDTLEKAPGFDKDNWPQMDETDWLTGIYEHYGHKPYWQ
jgi:sporulation protein YlmC with PRC-barrel domain